MVQTKNLYVEINPDFIRSKFYDYNIYYHSMDKLTKFAKKHSLPIPYVDFSEYDPYKYYTKNDKNNIPAFEVIFASEDRTLEKNSLVLYVREPNGFIVEVPARECRTIINLSKYQQDIISGNFLND